MTWFRAVCSHNVATEGERCWRNTELLSALSRVKVYYDFCTFSRAERVLHLLHCLWHSCEKGLDSDSILTNSSFLCLHTLHRQWKIPVKHCWRASHHVRSAVAQAHAACTAYSSAGQKPALISEENYMLVGLKDKINNCQGSLDVLSNVLRKSDFLGISVTAIYKFRLIINAFGMTCKNKLCGSLC